MEKSHSKFFNETTYLLTTKNYPKKGYKRLQTVENQKFIASSTINTNKD